MTDRYSYMTVALSQDIRQEDAEALQEAIKKFREVQDVSLGYPVNPNTFVARVRMKNEFLDHCLSFFDPTLRTGRD